MRRGYVVRRSAFSLLEVILALVIGVLLMIGLYFALDMHLAATHAGRVQVDQAQIARNVLKQIQIDIKDHLASLDTYPSATANSTSATGGTTGTTGTTGTSSTTSSSTTMASATTTNVGPFPFNLAVQGSSDWMAIYISKTPRAVVQDQANDPTQSGGNTAQAVDSDLRRIVYWHASGGLARQQVLAVTGSDIASSDLPPGGVDDMTQIVAPEVIDISFEYYDGTTWQASWDGTQLGPDMVTPIGPPVAIAITVSVARSDNLNASVGDQGVRQYRHVVHIPTASFYGSTWPNNTVNPAYNPSSTGTTSSTTGSTTGSTSSSTGGLEP